MFCIKFYNKKIYNNIIYEYFRNIYLIQDKIIEKFISLQKYKMFLISTTVITVVASLINLLRK